jgi:hypothetical protein
MAMIYVVILPSPATVIGRVGRRYEAVAKLLLTKNSIDPNSKDCNSWTPLLWTRKGLKSK